MDWLQYEGKKLFCYVCVSCYVVPQSQPNYTAWMICSSNLSQQESRSRTKEALPSPHYRPLATTLHCGVFSILFKLLLQSVDAYPLSINITLSPKFPKLLNSQNRFNNSAKSGLKRKINKSMNIKLSGFLLQLMAVHLYNLSKVK